MPLPTAPSTAELRPDRLRALIYGSPGAGKTPVRNPSSCFSYGRVCPFADRCGA